MFVQLSLFRGTKPFINNKPIRLIELFGGISAQATALHELGVEFEHYCYVDFDKYAVKSTNEMYGTNWATTDITKICAKDLGVVETDKYNYIMTYSFPCFTKDSLVLTDKGYKEINKISVGDNVLTHTNTYKPVVKTFDNGKTDVYQIKGMGIDEIRATSNHKFYVREMYRKGHFSIRTFREPIWKELKDLTKQDYLGVAINQNSIIPKWNGIDFHWSDGRKTRHKNKLSKLMDNESFWWIIGRYIGDGWIRNQGGIIICCAKSETQDITSKLDGLFNYSISEERTVNKIHLPLKELELFVSEFGRGAKNKELTNTIIDLPIRLLKSFVDGYISAYGCFTNSVFKASSISRNLIYGIAQCVAKVYKTPYRIYKTKRNKTCIIENRIVNQNDTYALVFKKDTRKQDKAFFEDGYIWFPIQKIGYIGKENVYDIEVDEDHSFTVQNTIVHNCTDLSLAGKQEGMAKGSGTRSGLLWEVERLLNETRELPQVLLMENVPQVHGKKNIDSFNEWQEFLESKGYKNYWQDLKATDFGIPQSRNRTFMVSIFGDYYYSFPKGFNLDYLLKDFLETEVDEKYYLSEKMINYVMSSGTKNFYYKPKIDLEIARPLTTKQDKRAGTTNYISEPKLNQVAQIQSKGFNEMTGRVYSTKGLCPTIQTMEGGNRQPKIQEPKSNIKNFMTDTANKHDSSVIENLRIRKLTPRECWRLMGFRDELFEKAQKVNSNSQLYKQAGNSIVVQVLMAIFGELLNINWLTKVKELIESLKE